MMLWPTRLSVVFRRIVRLGSFPVYWRQANFAPIPKGPPSYFVANYRPISITSVLPKVIEHMVSVRLGRFMEPNGVLPTTQFLIGKVWEPVMHFCECQTKLNAFFLQHQNSINGLRHFK